jgi:hypothetical protein
VPERIDDLVCKVFPKHGLESRMKIRREWPNFHSRSGKTGALALKLC